MSSRLPSSCRAPGSVDRGSVSGARPAGSSSERRHLRRDRTMERTAYMLRLLPPLLALGALAVAGCDDAYTPLSGPRADASVMMHQELRQEDRFGLPARSEEHTSELQSPCNLVCRLLLEKKKSVP